MLRMRAIALCARNVHSSDHAVPPALMGLLLMFVSWLSGHQAGTRSRVHIFGSYYIRAIAESFANNVNRRETFPVIFCLELHYIHHWIVLYIK